MDVLSDHVCCVFISLQDMNDFSPVFSQSVYRGMVAPNAVKGTIVTTVTAKDSDPVVSVSSCCYSIKWVFTLGLSNCVWEYWKTMMRVFVFCVACAQRVHVRASFHNAHLHTST